MRRVTRQQAQEAQQAQPGDGLQAGPEAEQAEVQRLSVLWIGLVIFS